MIVQSWGVFLSTRHYFSQLSRTCIITAIRLPLSEQPASTNIRPALCRGARTVLREPTNTQMHQNVQLAWRIGNYCLASELERARVSLSGIIFSAEDFKELHSFHRLRNHDKSNGFLCIEWKIFESTQQSPGLERSLVFFSFWSE